MTKKAIQTLLGCIQPGVFPSKPTDPDTSTFRRVVLRTSDGGSFAIGIPSNPGAGQGRTTLQLLGAPQGATYVWPESGTMRYPLALAVALGRDDLRIVPMSHVEHPAFARTTTSKVVIDHGCWGRRFGHAFISTMAQLEKRGLVDPPPEA